GEDHPFHDRGDRGEIGEGLLDLRDGVDAVRRGDLARDPREELQLHGEADLGLRVAEDVRGRVEELLARELDVPVDEDVLPRDEDVVEYQEGVRFIEARGQRIVERARLSHRVRAARVEPQAGRGDGR